MKERLTARSQEVAEAQTDSDGTIFSSEGRVKGYILNEEIGEFGFGYDPVFIPEGYDKTLAELDDEVKNSISHRRKAIEKMQEALSNLNLNM